MAQLTVIYWRDIPAQVIVRQGRKSARRQLDARFEAAIDRSAMRAKLSAADDYLAEWHRVGPEACEGDLEQVAEATATRLHTDYDDDRLKILIANKGFDPRAEGSSG